MRTAVLVLGSIGILAEAITLATGLYFLGTVIEAYQMSMDQMPPEHGRLAVWVVGGVLGVGLVLLAGLLAVSAVRGNAFGRTARILIIGTLVLNGILGFVAVLGGNVGLFFGLVAIFGCLLLGLILQPAPREYA
jgi:hypothetical protein